MLQVKHITKKYKTGDFVQVALDDVSLNLRDSEFVAILGPSGSGKTTLLNIIGGLDRYDSGDLVIDSVSTKKYRNRDWDSYRNHSVGFVFQSYNLIPHQTVLKNVELALTIGGISRRKRKQMALDALERVGLREQAHKRPNQMSGGQMQRVAIARALVNNPKIVLADEPTGALDTKTSIQIMDLLREVATDRLVVMVTHNPELAEQYANRTVRLQDGEIISDTNPYEVPEDIPAVHKNLGHASMSWLTSLGLSLNNLATKKGRTILTAFAGSIGIIGIALILSVSTGFQNYIDKIQEDTMTEYPLTVTSETADVFSAILSMTAEPSEGTPDGVLREQQFISSMLGSVTSNDLKSFKKYLEDNEDKYSDYVTKTKYGYSVTPLIYTIDVADNMAQINPDSTMSAYYGDSSYISSLYSSFSMSTFSEISDLEEMKENYEILAGRWPEKYDEMVAVVSDPAQISDLMLYSLGFRDTTKLKTILTKMMTGEEVTLDEDPISVTYDDLLSLDMRLIDPSDKYRWNDKYEIYEDMTADREYMNRVYKNSEKLTITGIVWAGEDNTSMTTGVFYLPELTDHVIDKASTSKILERQLANKSIDVFSGNRFDEPAEETGLDFNDMITVDEDVLASAFNINMPTNLFGGTDMTGVVMESAEAVSENIDSAVAGSVSALQTLYSTLSESIIQGYIDAFTQEFDLSSFMPGGGGGSVPPEEEPAPEEEPVPGEEPDPEQPSPEDHGSDPEPSPKAKVLLIYTPENAMLGTTEMYTPDVYKSMALSDSALDAMISQMSGLTISKDNLRSILGDAFDSYIANLTPSEMMGFKFVAESDIPAPAESVLSAVAAHDSDIFEEGSELAKQYTTLLVAQGIGEAMGEVMGPLSGAFSNMEDMFSIDTDKFASAFNFNMDEDELKRIMETMLSGSDTSYVNNLLALGWQDRDEPTTISFYFKDFASKNGFIDFLDHYNDTMPEERQIQYTDITGLLMGSVEKIINSVTYVLIAFVSISLVVSSIMIGIITYISVLERTKEIGILRAIGASKGNISSIFNAETFIIGLLSGILGVATSYLLLIPINQIIHRLTENNDITAVLDPRAAGILVVIATVLTIIGGLIPSRSAANKDPVIALRTE